MGITDQKEPASIKREGSVRLRHRCASRIAKMKQHSDDVEQAFLDLERDFEVVRQVWAMRFAGLGATAIVRELRSGPSWAWRSRDQVMSIANPGEWVLGRDKNKNGQGASR